MEDDSPLPPPPPPYIATREEFDRKTALVLEQSLEALSLSNQPGISDLEDIYEEWDEEAFKKAAGALAATKESSGSTSGSVSAPATISEPQFQSPPHPRKLRSELPTPPQGRTTERIQPLAIRKKIQPPVIPAPASQSPKNTNAKERPKWYAEAQLYGSSTSSSNESTEARNATQAPFDDDPDGEDFVELPPPPFSSQGPDLNRSPFEAVESKNIQHSLDPIHALSPHRHMSLPATTPNHHPIHLHRHQSIQQPVYTSPAQVAQQIGSRAAYGGLHSQGGPRLRMFDSSLAYGTKRTDLATYQTQTAPAAPSAFYNSTVSSVVEPSAPFKKRPGYRSTYSQPNTQNSPVTNSSVYSSNTSMFTSSPSSQSTNASIRSVSPLSSQYQSPTTRPSSAENVSFQQPYANTSPPSTGPYMMRYASNEAELNFP